MRLMTAITAACALLAGTRLSAQAYEHTILVDWNPIGGALCGRFNGIARFHFQTLPSGGVHSEYLEIRRRIDPFVP